MKKALVFHGDEIGFSPFHIEVSYLNAKNIQLSHYYKHVINSLRKWSSLHGFFAKKNAA